MSDIFLSYSSKDRERAAVVARALEARGWTVWWDRTIPPGRQYDDVIEEALAEASCAVVLWSKSSATSSWVKNEASEAMGRKALIPALIEDEVKIPFEFRRVQAADLSHWQGEPNLPEFVQFCDAIAAELAGLESNSASAPAPEVRPPAPAPVPLAAPPPRVVPIVLLLLVVASITSQPPPGPSPASAPSPLPDPAPLPSLESSPSPAPAPAPSPAPLAKSNATPPAARPVPGIQQDLRWRDHALGHSGHVSWDGTSNQAFITMNVFDGLTNTSLGSRQLPASVRPNGAETRSSCRRASPCSATASPGGRTRTASTSSSRNAPRAAGLSCTTACRLTIATESVPP